MLKHEDWFSHNIKLFQKYLAEYNKKPVKVIEIGVFEGRGTLWFLENILKHPKSKIYSIDIWNFFNQPQYKDVYSNFINNIAPYKDKVIVKKGYSSDMISSINDKVDFIYIDANHHSKNVLEDAVLSFRLLKKGGYMIFDDYTNNKEHDNNCPRMGIDAFMNIYSNEIKVLKIGWSVVIQKRYKNLPTRPCHSEFFREPKNKK